MSGWLQYEYVIATQPDQSEFPALNDNIMSRIQMTACGSRLGMSDADALIVVMDDPQRLRSTGYDDVFGFDGDRLDFNIWMAERHPDIGYCWIDQWVVAFADRAAQLSFDHDFGERVLRSVHLPRAA